MKDLDSDGKGTSAQLSEIDLSNPEDVKALIPDHNSEVLVHFGTENFLARYRKFQEHVVEWRTQYPRLSSVDMRYERQVVLQMPPKDSTVTAAAGVTPPLGDAAATAPVRHTAVAISKPPASLPPNTVASVPKLSTAKPFVGAKAAPAGTLATKDAATKKRVEAIKAWMAKRQQMRAVAGQAKQPPSTAGTPR